MILKDLIDIYYSPAILNNTQKYESIKNTIDNIEIDNVLNINKNISQKFFIIVTECNNKIKTTLDPIIEQYVSVGVDNENLDIGNMLDTISPELMNVLLEIGNSNDNDNDIIYDNDNENENDNDNEDDIIYDPDADNDEEDNDIPLEETEDGNEDNDDGDNENENENDIEDEASESYGFSDETSSDDELDNELYKSNIVYDLFTHKYIQLHIFQKKYSFKNKMWSKSKIKYLISLFFNDSLKINSDFNNIEHLNSSEDLDTLELSLCDIDFYYKNNYYFYDDFYNIYDYMNSYTLFTNEIYNKVNNLASGLYFNKNDILWQIFLCKILTSTETFNIKYIDRAHYTEFNYINIVKAYFPNYQPENASFYEYSIIKDHNIICDKCQNLITTEKFYNNHNFGDLCIECYQNKLNQCKARIKYLWHFMLLQGKKIVFQNQLEKTKIFLQNKKIKRIPRKKYYELLEKTTNTLLDKHTDIKKTCRICLDKMTDNIVVGSLCGHCFHDKCIKLMGKNQCPYCRKNTNFIKIYI